MDNNQIKISEEDFNKKSKYDKFFKKNNKNIEDKRFGNISVAKLEDSNKKIFKKENVVSKQGEFERDIVNLKKASLIDNDNILKLLDFSTHIQSGWCSKFFITTSYYEYPENDLLQEIENRKNKQKYFTEDELLSILLQISQALKFLQENDLYHGDIRPEYITCDFENFTFKLINTFDFNRNVKEVQSNYFLSLNKNIYLGPELYEMISTKKYTEYNFYKSDSFTLGLILLEAALLEDIQDIYGGRKNKQIDLGKLEYYLNSMDEKYKKDNIFLIVMKALVSDNIKDRPDFLELVQGISNIENNLENENNYNENNLENYNNYYPDYCENYVKNVNNNLKTESNNVNKKLEKKTSTTYTGKVTVYRYKINEKGEKELIEEPKTFENENSTMPRVSKTYVNEPVTQISRTYNIDNNVPKNYKEDIINSNTLVNEMVPGNSRTYVGEPILRTDENDPRLYNENGIRLSRSYKNEQVNVSKTYIKNESNNNEVPMRLSKTYENQPVVRLSRTYEKVENVKVNSNNVVNESYKFEYKSNVSNNLNQNNYQLKETFDKDEKNFEKKIENISKEYYKQNSNISNLIRNNSMNTSEKIITVKRYRIDSKGNKILIENTTKKN